MSRLSFPLHLETKVLWTKLTSGINQWRELLPAFLTFWLCEVRAVLLCWCATYYGETQLLLIVLDIYRVISTFPGLHYTDCWSFSIPSQEAWNYLRICPLPSTSNFSWSVADFISEIFPELDLSLFPRPLWPSSCLKTIATAIHYSAFQNSFFSLVWCQLSFQKNKFDFLFSLFKIQPSFLLTAV